MDKNDQKPKTSGASTPTYDRPLHVDEKSYDPLTIARMTDHNVTGTDDMENVGPRAMDNRFKKSETKSHSDK